MVYTPPPPCRYESVSGGQALGQERGEKRTSRRPRRYFSTPAEPAPQLLADDVELAQRTRAYLDMLAETPTDEALWLRFIHFQVSLLNEFNNSFFLLNLLSKRFPIIF